MAILERNDSGAIAHLQMNAPERLNALSDAMLAALQAEFEKLHEDRDIRAVILSGQSSEQADQWAREFGKAQPNADGVDVLGPAPAPITVLRGRHRRRFLVRTERNVDISAFLTAWRDRVKLPSGVRVTLDVEPYSFM